MKYTKVNLKIADNTSVRIPEYKTPGAACADVYAHSVLEADNERVLYGTGLFMEIPEGKCVKVYVRSGAGIVDGFALANGTGIIDSDYRGELKVCLVKHSGWKWQDFPKVGERICQIEICDAERIQFNITENLSVTQRGDGGLGHTGK